MVLFWPDGASQEAELVRVYTAEASITIMQASRRGDLPVVDSTVLAKNRAEVKSQFQLAEALLRMETP